MDEFDDVERLAEQLTRISDGGGAVRMEPTFHLKHGGAITDDQTHIYDAAMLAYQLEALMKAARDAQGFQAVVRGIMGGVTE